MLRPLNSTCISRGRLENFHKIEDFGRMSPQLLHRMKAIRQVPEEPRGRHLKWTLHCWIRKKKQRSSRRCVLHGPCFDLCFENSASSPPQGPQTGWLVSLDTQHDFHFVSFCYPSLQMIKVSCLKSVPWTTIWVQLENPDFSFSFLISP